MAEIRRYPTAPTARISTTFPYKRIHGIPEFGLPALHRVHSAGGSVTSIASGSAKSAASHIPPTEPCLVSKRPGYGLRKAQWINAIRDIEKANKKVMVEVFLLLLGVVPSGFKLNSASNMAPLDPLLHTHLDQTSFIATTCSKKTLKNMIQIVKAENEVLEREHGFSRRDLTSKLPFMDAEYELVVLHPKHFLPSGSAFLMHTEGVSPPPNPKPIFTPHLYMVCTDGALRVDSSDESSARYGAVPAPKSRKTDHALNPYLVVLNADMAFRRYIRSKPKPHVDQMNADQPNEENGWPPLCSDYQELVELTEELADLIYSERVVTPVLALLDPVQVPIGSSQSQNIQQSQQSQDVEMQDRSSGADQFGVLNEQTKGSDSTVKGRRRGGISLSRFGNEIQRPGPDASHEEQKDYLRYLISGRDNPLTGENRAALASIGLLGDDELDSDEDGEADSDEDDKYGYEKASIVDDDSEDPQAQTERKVQEWRGQMAIST